VASRFVTPRLRGASGRAGRFAVLALAVLAVAASLVAAACGALTKSAGESVAASPTPAVSPPWSGRPMSAAEQEAVRRVLTVYWAAYNDYDAERAIACLDESYRPAKEPVIRGEIRRLRTFSVTLGVREKSPPILIGPDEAEVFLSMSTPTGPRTVQMRFVRRDDTWAISYSEEVR
jgi:hypothetical protein